MAKDGNGSGGSTLNPNSPLFIPAALKQWRIFSPDGGNWLPLHMVPRLLAQSKGEDGFYDNAQGDVDNVAICFQRPLISSAGEGLPIFLEAPFEEFLHCPQTESKNGMNNYSKRMTCWDANFLLEQQVGKHITAVLDNLKSLDRPTFPVGKGGMLRPCQTVSRKQPPLHPAAPLKAA
ncbi:unnamed protein product [Prunus armeniaca]|uniref:Uncharacterized protein n=1 Tax=Prunus armeniaca TaxID=36596 RepID=A0A6J5VC10_PRUAR|nr:unnamed protein product [Prunus armeniaca]